MHVCTETWKAPYILKRGRCDPDPVAVFEVEGKGVQEERAVADEQKRIGVGRNEIPDEAGRAGAQAQKSEGPLFSNSVG